MMKDTLTQQVNGKNGVRNSRAEKKVILSSDELSARTEPFDSFWEAPDDIEKGYGRFGQFYRANYLKYLPQNKQVRTLVISCGPGYLVNVLREEGYTDVLGIDSYPEKIQYAQTKNLNCDVGRAFEFLSAVTQPYDLIFCEQELNHLTKDEMVIFLNLCWDALKPGGTLVTHGLNGANPITGAEALAQNFDHFNTFTSYSFEQVLEYCGFHHIEVFPLNLYVFYSNPLNYVGLFIMWALTLIFQISFKLYGKFNRIFSKKIGAVCRKPA